MLPRKFLEIRCSEISSEAILGQKQCRSSYMAREVLDEIFGCLCMHLLSQLTLRFPAGGVTSLQGQVSSARTSDLFTHVLTRASFIAVA